MEKRIDEFVKYKDVKSKLIFGCEGENYTKFCFVIPTYKRAKLLKRALLSLLEQEKDSEFNIVVIDNDEMRNNETEVLMESFVEKHKNMYYYKNEKNIGLFGNWNRCYEIGSQKGEFCCILMDDDELKPDYLRRIKEELNKEDYDCIRVGADILNQENKLTTESGLTERYHNRPGHMEKIDWRYFLFRGALPPSGMCIKGSVMRRLGGYKEEYWPGSDFELDTRLVRDYKVGMLWERLCVTHTEVSTSKQEKTEKASIYMGYLLCKKTYNEVFDKKHKYDWIANVRTFIAIDKNKYDISELGELALDYKYNNVIWKTFYKICYRIFWLRETYV